MKLPSIAIHLHHNASIAVYDNDDIACIIELERFINLKNSSYEFFEPTYVKDFVLEHAYTYLKDKFGYTKYDKFIIGEGFSSFPDKFKEVIIANEYIIDTMHHGSHSYNSLYQSDFNKALIISFDGGSNDGSFSVFIGEKGKDLEYVKNIPIDFGSHYHVISSFCDEIKNYHVLTGAGKLLGLQSYGKVVEEWKTPIRKLFNHTPYWHELEKRSEELSNEIGIPFSKINKLSGENSYNIARTTQQVFEELFFENIDNLVEKYELPIIITGGCALNIVLNTKVKERYNRNVFVAPNSSDCGLPVGLLCKYLRPTKKIDITYKGVDVLDKYALLEYIDARRGRKLPLEIIANDLIQGRILGVVQGNAEHGPRALGNRSIVCSPIPENMKDILNLKVKHREWYRPFAPIVRLEDVSEYFEWEGESRWMNFCPKVREEYKEKLPAITHIDGTARVQTITREQNPFMYDLLTCFKEKTGIGVLVNTSFNVDGKPILSTYKDAFKVFDETELDRLYLDGYYFTK